MEDQSIKKENEQDDSIWLKMEKDHRRGKIMGGLLIVVVGALFLARELGAEIPAWVFSWKMLLIGLGLISAVKHKFMHPSWIILIGVGGAFLLSDLYPEMSITPIIWPCLLIMLGLIIIFKPRRKRAYNRYKRHWEKWHHHHHQHQHHHQHHYQDWHEQHKQWHDRAQASSEDFINSTVFMAGVKKNILTKNFKGGDVTNIFGGAELNLSQADFEGRANLEITQVFGGTKLIVPSNWEIRSELVTVFGSVEDKRPGQPIAADSDPNKKVLVLTGTTFFGGIDIRSFS